MCISFLSAMGNFFRILSKSIKQLQTSPFWTLVPFLEKKKTKLIMSHLFLTIAHAYQNFCIFFTPLKAMKQQGWLELHV